MKEQQQPDVLIVEDEPELADLYRNWLSKSCAVRTAYNGTEALEALDEDPDIVFLDRRMPDVSGDFVLEEIRERSLNCRVAMVTAVEPDTNIVEMGFDDYLLKPVSEEEITGAVEWLMSLASYDDILKEYYSLASKIGVLEMTKERDELEASEEYVEAKARFEALKAQEQDRLDELHNDGKSDRVFSRIVNHWNRKSADPSV